MIRPWIMKKRDPRSDWRLTSIIQTPPHCNRKTLLLLTLQTAITITQSLFIVQCFIKKSRVIYAVESQNKIYGLTHARKDVPQAQNFRPTLGVHFIQLSSFLDRRHEYSCFILSSKVQAIAPESFQPNGKESIEVTSIIWFLLILCCADRRYHRVNDRSQFIDHFLVLFFVKNYANYINRHPFEYKRIADRIDFF